MADIILDIPGLGRVQGACDQDNGVYSFLGLQYGAISERFGPSELETLGWNSIRDGTKFGPSCPQVESPISGLDHDSIEFSEFGCLSLNVFLPAKTDLSKISQSGLKILVWVHGGSFMHGSSSSEIYNGVPFVANAEAEGFPVAFVSLNYRLGMLGWFACDELLQEQERQLAAGLRKNPIKALNYSAGNQGLVDVGVALQWVAKYLCPALGSTVADVTTMGVSIKFDSEFATIMIQFICADYF